MKSLFKISLLVLMISFVTNSNAQVPADHPAMQMRKYYADIYTGQSIVCFETHSLDSVLGSCISVHSSCPGYISFYTKTLTMMKVYSQSF